jgi:8-oxo-dGTP diphosphatase
MGVTYISACHWGATPGGTGGPERVSREIGRKNDLRVGVTIGGEPREGWQLRLRAPSGLLISRGLSARLPMDPECETPHMAMIDLVRRVARPFPGKRMAVGSLLHDGDGRLLIVDPPYRRGWSIPGGMIGRNESPLRALEREVEEEVGLRRSPGRLLCVDYLSADGTRSEAVMMIFDGGVLIPDEIARIRLPRVELRGHAFHDPAVALDMVEPDLRKRIEAALAVGAGDAPCYLEDGYPVQPGREIPG